MRFPSPSARTAVVAVTVLASVSLAACGGSSADESDSSDAPPVSAFPKTDGKPLKEFLTGVGLSNEIIPALAGSVFSPGDHRLGLGLFDVGGKPITDAEVAVYAQVPGSKEAMGPFPAKVESLHTEPAYASKTTTQDPDAAQVVYVADVPFDSAGTYLLGAVIKTADGKETSTPLQVSPESQPKGNTTPGAIDIEDNDAIPAVGDPAIKIDTPTVDSVGGDIASIDTRDPHDDMHDINLADVLGEKPVVLLFATPALCTSRVCGPVVDVEEQVKSEFKDDVDFIHMEIYKDNKPPNPRPQVSAYGLQSEPWLFVINKEGDVSTRIEGAFSVPELDDAVKKVLPGGSDA
ncbi:hypothetical protein BH10ACT11_BH10ACT11_13210 [soil metagenome]